MDAVPVTLGQEFGGYAAQVRSEPTGCGTALAGSARAARRHRHRHRPQHTSQFGEKARGRLSADSGLEISAPADPFEAQGNRDALQSRGR